MRSRATKLSLPICRLFLLLSFLRRLLFLSPVQCVPLCSNTQRGVFRSSGTELTLLAYTYEYTDASGARSEASKCKYFAFQNRASAVSRFCLRRTILRQPRESQPRGKPHRVHFDIAELGFETFLVSFTIFSDMHT